MNRIIILFSILNFAIFSEPLQVTGNQLIGSFVNGETIREVIGNVKVTQSDIIITCQRAIQNITRNTIQLIGDVVITQKNKVLISPVVYYNGNTRVAEAPNNVRLIDGNMILTSKSGNFNYKDEVAFFYNDVKLESENKLLTCNYLTYYSKENKAIAQENVTLVDSVYRIKADQIVYYKNNKNAFAKDDIQVFDTKDNSFIYCNELEYYHYKKLAIFYKNPYFISTKENGDTLLIKCRKIEVNKMNNTNIDLVDSVYFYYNDLFAYDNNIKIKNNDTIILPFNTNEEKPFIIYQKNQFTADSINIFKIGNMIDKAILFENALMISQIPEEEYRFNQVTATKIIVNFADNKPKIMNLYDKVLAYYYIYENDTIKNGVVKISSDNGKIMFDSSKISEIKLYGDIQSDYYPENKILGNEKDYFVYNFVLNKKKYNLNFFIKKLKKEYRKYFAE
ncbi:MAG TPA: OstA-like protein [Ignavibacteriales bacterium]|jgi:hypothetical protein|nr:OstA-like protein [Ignavibacteriales bacterium]